MNEWKFRAIAVVAMISLIGSCAHASPSAQPQVRLVSQSPTCARLFTAIKQRAVELVDSALKDGADIECPAGRLSSTPLMEASADGSLDIVKLLIKRGAAVNAVTDDFGLTPLTRAAAAGHADVVKYLIAHGADVNINVSDHGSSTYLVTEGIGPRYQSPLSAAAFQARLAIIDILLDHGAKIDAKDGSAYTPLMWAATLGSRETIMLLLKHGADRTIKSDKGETAKDMATRYGYTEAADALDR